MRLGEIQKEEWAVPDQPPQVEPNIGPEIPPETIPEEPAIPETPEVPVEPEKETVPMGAPMTPGVRKLGFGPMGPNVLNSVMCVPLGLNWKKMDELGYLHEEGPKVQYFPKRRSEPEVTSL